MIFVALLGAASVAQARPGFYIGFGIGPTNVSGQDVEYSRLGGAVSGPRLLTTELDGGLTGNFRMGFNILGYVALETQLSGHQGAVGDGDSGWAAHWHTGARVYPLWHWQRQLPEVLQPFEPSLFYGLGTSYQAYQPGFTSDDVGYSQWGTWRLGLGLEYFIITYFKVGLEYTYVRANYATFIYNFEDGIDFPIEPAASTGFHQFLLMALFQFGPAQEPVRYAP